MYSRSSYQVQKDSESTLKKKGEAMLITRECDYAVRIVRALAGGQKICVTQICEEEVLTPDRKSTRLNSSH